MRKTKNLTIAEMPEDDAKEIKEILGSWKRGVKLSDKVNKRRGTPLMAIINPRKEEDAKIKK